MSEIELGPVPVWSYSRLTKFEQCPYQVYLAAVKKEKPKERPDDNPAERGNREHKVAEDFVNGKAEKMSKLMKADAFKDDFLMLRDKFDDGKVETEGDWGFDIDWQEHDWWGDKVWARIKLDVFERFDEHTAKVIDHKTGKKFGNEVKHTGQAQLYMVGAFMRYPELTMIETEFWYLDQNTKMKKTYTRNKLPLYLRKFNERALRLTTCQDFIAKPSKMNCRWCDFGVENGTGACQYAVPLES